MSRLNTLLQDPHDDVCEYLARHTQYQKVDDALICHTTCIGCYSNIPFIKLKEIINE